MKRINNFSWRSYAMTQNLGRNLFLIAILLNGLYPNLLKAQFGCDPSVVELDVVIPDLGDCIDFTALTLDGQCCTDSLIGPAAAFECVQFNITLPTNACVALMDNSVIGTGKIFVDDDCENSQFDGSNITPSDPLSGMMTIVYCADPAIPHSIQLCGKTCCNLTVTCPDMPATIYDCLGSIPAAATDSTEFVALAGATISESCGGLSITSVDDVSGGLGCPDDTLIVTRTYTIADMYDTTTCDVIYRVVDTVVPTFTMPADITIDCEEPRNPNNTGRPTNVADNCGGVVTVTRSMVRIPGSCPDNFVLERTWQFVDECGNEIDSIQRITVQDTTPPTFTPARDTMIECMTDTSVGTLGMPTNLMDNCGTPVVTYMNIFVAAMCPMEFTIQRVWMVEDDCENIAIDTQYITMVDTVAPMFMVPPDANISCEDDTSAIALGEPTLISDNCSDTYFTHDDNIITGPCAMTYTIERIWMVFDECGNVAIDTQTIEVEDDVRPTLTAPSDTTVSCESNLTPASLGFPTDTSDNCSVYRVYFEDLVTDSTCPNEIVIRRRWFAEDECGNRRGRNQIITVVDTTNPTIIAPDDVLLSCEEVDRFYGLYTVSPGDDTLRTIDVADATTTSSKVMSLDGSVITGATGLATHPATGELWVILKLQGLMGNRALATIDHETGEATLVGLTGDAFANITFNEDGSVLWGVTGDGALFPESLFTIDQSDASTTYICFLGAGTDGEAIHYNPYDNKLYHASGHIGPEVIFEVITDPTLDPCATTPINITGSVLQDEEAQAIVTIPGSGSMLWKQDHGTGPIFLVNGLGHATLLGFTDHQIKGMAFVALAPNMDMASANDNCSEPRVYYNDSIIEGDCIAEYTIRRAWIAVDACENMAADTQIIEVECIEDLRVSKEIIDIDPPESGVKGQFNATFELTVLNNGNTWFDSIGLQDQIEMQYGNAFVGVVTGGEPKIVASTATETPLLDPDFDGRLEYRMLDEKSGLMYPGEYFKVQFTIEVNPFAPGVHDTCYNSAIGSAYGPCQELVIDSSDTGSDPATTNPFELGDTGGEDDPTVIPHNCVSQWAEQIACNGHVNISLGKNCDLDILPSMILEGEKYGCDLFFEVMITDHHGRVVPSPVPGHYKGETLYVKVIDAIYGNSCWGTILLEDKWAPVIECENDTVYCNQHDSVPPPHFYDNCDPDPTLHLVRETKHVLTCDDNFTKRIVRYWQAEDSCGNKSQLCEQVIMLKRIPFDSISYPKNFTLDNNCALKCNGNYPLDSLGHPDPSYTGSPNIHGYALYPFNQYCNVNTYYEDQVLKHGPCLKKILRIWHVLEWHCGIANYTEVPQLIHIIDDEAPIIVCPKIDYVTTNGGYTCVADIDLPPAFVYDSCSHDSVRVDIHYPGGVLINQNGGRIQLPYGDHVVTYVAYDQCYNSDTCQINIEVRDHTPPVTICDGFTTIGLNEFGEAHLYAHVLDDGTYDDCYLDSFAVRRMDLGANCGYPDTIFRSYVRFCCADVGTNVMVVFRAWDKAGNYNDCMVEVEVQDKIPPHIYCPPNITVSCDYHFDPDSLGKYFGKIVQDYHDREPIVINDHYASWDGPLYDGHVLENCPVDIREEVHDSTTQCRTGFLLRGFTATDALGNTSKCYQKITFVDHDPFDSTDIVWPDHYTTSSCGLDFHPDNLPIGYGWPEVNDDICNLPGMEWEDHVFSFIPDTLACFKILRKWKIIDWCNFEFVNGTYEYKKWTFEQIIKVNNSIAPVFQMDCEEKMVCSYDPDCLSGYIELTAEAVDDCTPDDELQWHYKIDLHSDGIADTTVFGSGRHIDASGDYPNGWHEIIWVYEDQCGNRSVCTQPFHIVNCKPPTPYCKNGVITELMPIDSDNDGVVDTGLIDVWASDLDQGSYHACGNPVVLSFTSDTTDKFRRYGCDSLGMRVVTIWVTDVITGEQATCVTFVEIQDNNGICADSLTRGVISGRLYNEDNDAISAVKVELQGSSPLLSGTFDGLYAFSDVLLNNDYTVVPHKDDDPLNGINTRDIVVMQRHLLGKEELVGPYNLIAADVNRNDDISARDIVELRKLLLGDYSKFPNNNSWRFVAEGTVFNDPKNPFATNFKEAYDINSMPGNMMDMNFRGLKVGDVDGSADPDGLNGNGSRGHDAMFWTIEEVETVGGNAVFEVSITESSEMFGAQFTIDFDNSTLDFVEIVEGEIHIAEGHLGFAQIDNGLLRVSWNNENSIHVSKGGVLFKLVFNRLASNGNPPSIVDDLLMSEVYVEDLETRLLASRSGKHGIGELIVSQNNPNPFDDATVVRITSPERQIVTFKVYDVTGKIFMNYEIELIRGNNYVEVDRSDLSHFGVYYYQVESREQTISKKMIFAD